ncbi:alpha/beta fold hydrolase [Sporolactobacillus sp. THM19-2]|uniref:alpha/beta fold hydrolase n=1 Tax=Sporolactobacillus sp. THM19-2 TaxID=2511171 RepID=UPI001F0EA8CE|nr:alpha/beta hydrolase [Sporolactobacillus sp. THM19-2]
MFDSWFSSPKMFHQLRQLKLHTVDMVKRSKKVYYRFNGEMMDVKAIFKAQKKRRLPLLIEELQDLLRHLNLKRVHLVGCRYGAILALETALHDPSRIGSLTLMSLPFYCKEQDYAHESQINFQLLKLDRHLFEKKYLLESVQPVTEEKTRLIATALRRVPDRLLAAPVQELLLRARAADFDLIGKLRKVRPPVLFIHGEYDPVFPASLAMLFSTYVPNNRFMVAPDASALIPLDQPQFAADLFVAFMKSDKRPLKAEPEIESMLNSINRMIERKYHPHTVHHRELLLSAMRGETHVFWNGREIDGNWNKRTAKELLLFIILNKGAVKRDTIIDALTPDLALNQARNRLRVALNYLHHLFDSQEEPGLHQLLLISRDTVALNAHAVCDIGLYVKHLDDLLWSDEPIMTRSEIFLSFLEDYHSDMLKDYTGVWMKQLAADVKNRLSQMLAQILIALKKEKNITEIRRVLQKGNKVEPYEGFCDGWMNALGQMSRENE